MTCWPTCPTGVYTGGSGHEEPAHMEAGGRDCQQHLYSLGNQEENQTKTASSFFLLKPNL